MYTRDVACGYVLSPILKVEGKREGRGERERAMKREREKHGGKRTSERAIVRIITRCVRGSARLRTTRVSRLTHVADLAALGRIIIRARRKGRERAECREKRNEACWNTRYGMHGNSALDSALHRMPRRVVPRRELRVATRRRNNRPCSRPRHTLHSATAIRNETCIVAD